MHREAINKFKQIYVYVYYNLRNKYKVCVIISETVLIIQQRTYLDGK